MDTSTQGETPNALQALPNNEQCTSLSRNTGRGALIKQLFAPHGACAAPIVVCPPPVVRKSAKELTTLEPCTLPPLLPRTHIRPMTIDYGRLSSSSLAPSPMDTPDTPIQAALNQVTSSQSRLSTFAADRPKPTELALPKPYSTPLPQTSPVIPVFDEVPVGSLPSPMDLENDLPLNSIPVAEIWNAFLQEDASLMPVILSGPGLQRSGTAVKLLVSAPKPPWHRYGRSRNQRRRAAHAKARVDLIEELEKAANNRFNEWLGSVDKATDAEVADLLAGIPAKRPEQYDPTVPSPPGLSSPSHLYQSPLRATGWTRHPIVKRIRVHPPVLLFLLCQRFDPYSRNLCTRLGRQFLPWCLMCHMLRANHHVMDRSSTPPVVSALRAILSMTENWISVTTRTRRNMPGPSPHQ